MVETDNQLVSSLKTEVHVLHEEWNPIIFIWDFYCALTFSFCLQARRFCNQCRRKKAKLSPDKMNDVRFCMVLLKGRGVDINIGASLLCEQSYWHFPFPGKFNFLLAYSLSLTSIFQYGPDELLLFLELLLDEKKIPLTGLSSLKKKYCFDKCNAEVCWEGSIIDRNSFTSIKSLKGWLAVRY